MTRTQTVWKTKDPKRSSACEIVHEVTQKKGRKMIEKKEKGDEEDEEEGEEEEDAEEENEEEEEERMIRQS